MPSDVLFITKAFASACKPKLTYYLVNDAFAREGKESRMTTFNGIMKCPLETRFTSVSPSRFTCLAKELRYLVKQKAAESCSPNNIFN